MPRMLDSIQPPTDNLYKFLAIGGLAFALVAFVALLREQSRLRDAWIDAQIELQAAAYVESSGLPTDPALRPAYLRREWAHAQLRDLLAQTGGFVGKSIATSLFVSALAFIGWFVRVQRHDDALLRLAAAKAEREEAAACGGNTSHAA